MKLLLSILLVNLVFCGNIYWKNTSSMNEDKDAHILIKSKQPPHQVELVTNTEDTNNGWTKVWSGTVEYNEFKYKMPPEMRQCRYYAFKLQEGDCAHYTKPMYLSKDGRWMNPETESESISNDGKKDKNAASSCVIFGAFAMLIATQMLI